MGNIDFLHGGNIYEIEKKYKKVILDFSANINPLGLPRQVKKALYKNFERILHYPDCNAPELVQKIAAYWRINAQNILLGNGSAELIYLIVNAFKPKTVLIPAPTFSEYERAAKSVRAKVRFLRLEEKNNFRLNSSRPNPDKADMFFLCHPNNPTGNFILDNYDGIERLADRLVVVDEAFMDFLPQQEKHSMVYRAIKSKKVAVLRTFTKMFALPGLRIGYLVAHKDTVSKLRKHRCPWNTNSLAQLAAELVLENKEYVERSMRLIEKERKFLSNEIAKCGRFEPYFSLANFLFIKIKDANTTSSLLRKRLIQKGILIRDCSNFRGLNNKFIRIAVRSRKENLKLIKALRNVRSETSNIPNSK